MPSLRALYLSDNFKAPAVQSLSGACNYGNYEAETDDQADNMTVYRDYYDEEEEDAGEPSPPVPPDGGWGWVVMIASLMCNVIVDGVCYSFGVFYVEIRDYFDEPHSKTTMVGSALAGCYLMMGPFASALANMFGCRKVAIAGGCISCVAFILSTLAPNVNVLIVTYGVMGGIGFGLVYLPAIVTVGFYFERWRAFATGVSVCGSGIGTFVFAPLSRYLLETYDWKGGTLVMAGIILNAVVFGALFRPLEPQRRKRRKYCAEDLEDPIKNCVIFKKLIEEKKRQRTISTHSLDNVIINWNNELIRDNQKTEKVRSIRNILRETFSRSRFSLNRSKQSVIQVPRIRVDQSSCSNVTPPSVTPDSGVSAGQSRQSLSIAHNSAVVKSSSPLKQLSGSCLVRTSPKNSPEFISRRYGNSSPLITDSGDPDQQALDVSRPIYRQDIFYSGSCATVPEFMSSNQNVEQYVNSITSIPPEQQSPVGLCAFLPKSMLDALKLMLDVKLLTSPTFLLLCFSSVFAMFAFFVPVVFITGYALSQGITLVDASLLISILGVTNTVGRVFFGIISDRSWADCLLINNLALIIAGIATALVPLSDSFQLLAIYSSVFGLSMAAFTSQRSIILVDLLGLEKLTNAFGLLILFQGVATLIGSPVAGLIYDETGTSEISFYVAGALFLVSGLSTLPLRSLSRWEQARKIRRKTQPDTELVDVAPSDGSGDSDSLSIDEQSRVTVL